MDAWQAAIIIAALALLVHDDVTARTLLLLSGVGVGYWLAFALNDFYDAPYDALDAAKGRRNFFVSVPLAQRQRWKVVLWLIGLFPAVALLQFGWRALFVFTLSVFIIWAYSAPPLRLKGRPGLDVLTHAVFVESYPYVVMLLLTGAHLIWLDGVIVGVIFLASLTAQLEQQVRDIAVDAQAERNFTIVLGRERTRRLLQGATTIMVLFATYHVYLGTFPLYFVPIGLISLPAMLHRFLRPREADRSEKLVLVSTSVAFVYTIGLLVVLG